MALASFALVVILAGSFTYFDSARPAGRLPCPVWLGRRPSSDKPLLHYLV
jgi:hypothetical protein